MCPPHLGEERRRQLIARSREGRFVALEAASGPDAHLLRAKGEYPPVFRPDRAGARESGEGTVSLLLGDGTRCYHNRASAKRAEGAGGVNIAADGGSDLAGRRGLPLGTRVHGDISGLREPDEKPPFGGSDLVGIEREGLPSLPPPFSEDSLFHEKEHAYDFRCGLRQTERAQHVVHPGAIHAYFEPDFDFLPGRRRALVQNAVLPDEFITPAQQRFFDGGPVPAEPLLSNDFRRDLRYGFPESIPNRILRRPRPIQSFDGRLAFYLEADALARAFRRRGGRERKEKKRIPRWR